MIFFDFVFTFHIISSDLKSIQFIKLTSLFISLVNNINFTCCVMIHSLYTISKRDIKPVELGGVSSMLIYETRQILYYGTDKIRSQGLLIL